MKSTQSWGIDAPRRCGASDTSLPEVLKLIQDSFAYMEGRIDPPTSMNRLTVEALSEHAGTQELWVIGAPPVACIQMTEKQDILYLGKIAVSSDARGRGMARRLIKLAEQRAKAKQIDTLELFTRIELVENHACFSRLGFIKICERAHAGFDRPTYIVMRKEVAQSDEHSGP